MKKKILAAVMAGLMAFSAVGCGGNSGDTKTDDKKAEDTKKGDKTDITLWTYPVGKWGDSETVKELVSDFNKKYPDVDVKVEYLDYQSGDDQVNTAIEGNNAPDMVLEGPERLVANWGEKGYMVDLKDLFEEDASKDFYENVKKACESKDGKFYEYPMCMVAHCMAINEKMFEDADAMQYLDAENHTWTTENFLKAVQAVYDSGHKDVLALYCSGQGGDQGTRALVNNLYGGKYTNAEHTEYTVDSKENIKALEALKKQEGVKFDPSINGGEEITLFRNGTLACSLCWNVMQQTNADNAPAGETNNGDKILPMMFPTENGEPELCGGIWGFGVFDNGDEKKIAACKDFINFMCNDDEEAKKAVKASGFFPTHKEMTGVYDGTDNADQMKMFTEKFMPHLGDYYQVVPAWAEARTEWWNMLQRIGSEGKVKDQVKDFQNKVDEAVKAAK